MAFNHSLFHVHYFYSALMCKFVLLNNKLINCALLCCSYMDVYFINTLVCDVFSAKVATGHTFPAVTSSTDT